MYLQASACGDMVSTSVTMVMNAINVFVIIRCIVHVVVVFNVLSVSCCLPLLSVLPGLALLQALVLPICVVAIVANYAHLSY